MIFIIKYPKYSVLLKKNIVYIASFLDETIVNVYNTLFLAENFKIIM